MKITLIALMIGCCCFCLKAQGTWTKKADYPPAGKYNVPGFAIGDKGYVGTGFQMDHPFGPTKDFWEYDSQNDSWTQKTDFPGDERYNAIGFAIDNMGYIGLGQDFTNYFNDLYRYNPQTNTWDSMASLPATGRITNVFTLMGKAYIVGGFTGIGTQRLNEVWEYNPQTNSWAQKSDFPGNARDRAISFQIGNKGYFGLGSSMGWLKDFWEYDPQNDTWTRKADFGGEERGDATAFTIGNFGFVVGGSIGIDGRHSNEVWMYNSSTNTWSQIGDFPEGEIRDATAISINNRVFFGLGFIEVQMGAQDIWYEFIPPTGVVSIPKASMLLQEIKVAQQPGSRSIMLQGEAANSKTYSLAIINTAGKTLYEERILNEEIMNGYQLDLSGLPSGIYILNLFSPAYSQNKRIILK